MKKATLTQIKNDILDAGGYYKKCAFYLNGSDCYEVNGRVHTKDQMVELYMMGEL